MILDSKLRAIIDVASWQLCCGCGACAALFPNSCEMIDTLDHGRRPRLLDPPSDIFPDLAMTVCPGIGLKRIPQPSVQIGGARFYDVWGPVLGVWEGHAADSQIRFEGSSGGAATALALFGLERLDIQGVMHVRAREDVPYMNKTALSTDRNGLLQGAGSRYAPASPCERLTSMEHARGPFVFIGKPCDVAAVGKAVSIKPQLGPKIGLTISFFCAGTPSTAGTLEMLRRMGVASPSSVKSLRYRGRGWPGMANVAFRNQEGALEQRQLTYEQSWGEILQKHRPWRCYICADHIGEYADIAVADAWHRSVKDHHPGRSVIIARTPRGKAVIKKAIEEGYLEAGTGPADTLPQCRPSQAEYMAQLWARLQILKVMGIPSPEYDGFALFDLWKSELSAGKKIHSLLSTMKRVFVKKLYLPRTMHPLTLPGKN